MSWRTKPRPTSAPSLILVGALFALAVVSGCTRGLWDIGSLEARYPPVQATKGHRLGDATPYLFPANGAVQFFLCRWPDREPIPLWLRGGAEPELQEAVERAARAWEAALGIRFERREAPSGRGIEIRFADDVSEHGIAKLRFPVPTVGARDMAFVVRTGVDIDLDEDDTRITSMFGDPIG